MLSAPLVSWKSYLGVIACNDCRISHSHHKLSKISTVSTAAKLYYLQHSLRSRLQCHLKTQRSGDATWCISELHSMSATECVPNLSRCKCAYWGQRVLKVLNFPSVPCPFPCILSATVNSPSQVND